MMTGQNNPDPRERPAPGTLAAALEREHRQIDIGVESFLAARAEGRTDPAPLLQALDALRRHIYLEEEILFPPLRADLVAPIHVMLREHGEIWVTVDAIESELNGGESSASLGRTCAELLEQLERHNVKEEPIIYTQADAALSAAAGDALRAFLESGRMPDGWVCTRARA